jgi:hypothetical protein
VAKATLMTIHRLLRLPLPLEHLNFRLDDILVTLGTDAVAEVRFRVIP